MLSRNDWAISKLSSLRDFFLGALQEKTKIAIKIPKYFIIF